MTNTLLKNFRVTTDDVKASLAVFLIAVPLCLGIALASGAPASSGIIAGIIGGLIVGFLSGSEISVSGPAAGLTVIVAGAISQLGSFEAVCLATAMAGILQVILARLRFGIIGTLIPVSVITGMLAAIGIIIILKQIPHAVGFDGDYFGDESFLQKDGDNTFTALSHSLSAVSMGAILVSALAAFVLLTWDRVAKKVTPLKLIPAALVVVVVAILANEFLFPSFGFELSTEHLVSVPTDGGLFQFLPFMGNLESFSLKHLTVALTIALVASLESLLSIDASEKIDPMKRPVDSTRELYAQGAANFTSGLLGGLPITAVIVRTTANVSSGGRHRSAGIFHALWLLVFALFFPGILNKIPLAALAMILIFVGFKLTSPKLYKSFFKKGVDQLTPFLVTIIAILVTDLLVGVLIGFLVGIAFTVINSVHSVILLVREDNHYLVRFSKDTSFLNKPLLKKMLMSIPPDTEVVIDGSRAVHIDPDIINVVEDFTESALHRNIRVVLRKSSLALSPYFKE